MELRSSAIYKRYQDWCSENGFKYENAANFNKKLGQLYIYARRRPWFSKGEGETTMVNDVTWRVGEEPEQGLVPAEDEFEVMPDKSQ